MLKRSKPSNTLTITALCALLSATVPMAAYGNEVAGVRLRPAVNVNGTRLPLRGAGLLRYKVVFKGYVLGLYVQDDVGDPLQDVAKQLTFHYFWDIKAEDFVEAANKLLGKNLGKAAFAGLQDDIEAFHNLYVDIEEGDRYQLRYHPKVGTQLRHNGKLLGTVKGRAFAKAYFGIWLGDTPLDKPLKKKILTPIRGR